MRGPPTWQKFSFGCPSKPNKQNWVPAKDPLVILGLWISLVSRDTEDGTRDSDTSQSKGKSGIPNQKKTAHGVQFVPQLGLPLSGLGFYGRPERETYQFGGSPIWDIPMSTLAIWSSLAHSSSNAFERERKPTPTTLRWNWRTSLPDWIPSGQCSGGNVRGHQYCVGTLIVRPFCDPALTCSTFLEIKHMELRMNQALD